MPPQLIYTVRQLFTAADTAHASQAACLADYEANDFLIAAYQRGYKWKAAGGLVENLLTTLHEAFEAEQQDYYLQYLTVKKQTHDHRSLEVIDGQQRLTTLTLFFGVGRATGWLSGTDFTLQRLRYDIRQDAERRSLLDRYVYDTVALNQLLGLGAYEEQAPDWGRFVASQPPGTDRQDMYHLFEAAHCIYRFGRDLESDNRRRRFWEYVADRARLIVNSVEPKMTSETVFNNLNDNRRELTDLDLVKGLLLTRPAREGNNTFRQILELRTAQGRQWDEMANWLAQPAVAAVFGLSEHSARKSTVQPGLHMLMTLLVERRPEWAAFKRRQTSGNPKRFPLYTFLRRSLSGKLEQAGSVLQELRELYLVMRDWYEDTALRNGLGVLMASGDYDAGKFRSLLRRITAPDALRSGSPRTAVWAEISRLSCLNALSDTDAGASEWPASYGENNTAIRDLLLLMSAFPAQARNGRPVPFDFASFREEKWSLEHIFPQNPDESFRNLSPADQVELLSLMEPSSQEAARRLLSIDPAGRTDQEGAELADILLAASSHLNSLGNLVLLSIGNNIALRNYAFSEKRRILNRKVAEGSFVPAHTFGVFARLVPEGATERLSLWGPQEMQQHQAYLLNERTELQKFFS